MNNRPLKSALRTVFLSFIASFYFDFSSIANDGPTLLPPVAPVPIADSPQLYPVERLIGDDNYRKLIAGTDGLGAQIPSLIYNSISHYGVTLLSVPNFGLNLRFGRDVYDNRSVLGSWTVVDQIAVDGNIPLFNSNTMVPGLVNGLSFYIGTDLGVVVTDIRQVSPPHYSEIPSIQERAKKISRGDTFKNFLKTIQLGFKKGFEQVQGQWVQFINEEGHKLVSFLPGDAQSYARFSKIWNMFLTPFRLPLNILGLHRMDKDEIISYEGQGSLQSGFGTGFSIDPTGLTGALSAGVSVSAFSRGIFRISILKESDSIAKVKITKTGTLGHQWTAGSDATPGFLDNFVIIRTLTNLIKILPFQLSHEADHAQTFEVTYQYDVSTQGGAHAYENAVLGNLKPSDELAVNPQGKWRSVLTETGVLRVSDFQSHSKTTSISDHMQLTFLFRQNETGQVIDTVGVLTTPDGAKKTLTALAQNTKEWGLVFNQFQKYQHNFVVNLDLDLCEREPKACQKFPMQIEGRIDDSDTTQAALLHYILEVENSVGQPQIFPRTPEIRDLRDFSHDPYHPFYFYHPGHDLGGSHFYYSLNLNADQVQEFIDYPEIQMWPALERAFNITPGGWTTEASRWAYGISRSPVSFADLFLNLFQLNWAPGTDLFHAEGIWAKWKNLKNVSHPIEKAEALAKTFLDPLYSKKMTHLVRSVLVDQNVDYFANGSNRVFGNVTHHGGTRLSFEDLASQMSRSVELKKTPTPEELDPELQVNGLRFQEMPNGEMQLNIDTSIAPDSYYVDLTIDDWSSFLFRNKLTFAKVFKNPGLPSGESSIPLSSSDVASDWADLAHHIQPNIRYVLRVAISRDGQKWGRVAQTEFRLLRHKAH